MVSSAWFRSRCLHRNVCDTHQKRVEEKHSSKSGNVLLKFTNNLIMQQFITQNLWLVIVAAIWSLSWKGVALWKAARRSDKPWFFAILVINTLGLLEILYIFTLNKRKS